MTKLFQCNEKVWDTRINKHFQFIVIKGITLLHLMYENDSPCPYTGVRILATFLQPDCLFGLELQVKGYSWSFYLLSHYWAD